MDIDRMREAADITLRLRDELAALKHHFDVTESLRGVPKLNSQLAESKYWPLIERHLLVALSISLYKIVELYEKYQSALPDEPREKLKDIYQEIIGLGIRNFRNQYCGHIQDFKTKTPISEEQIEAHFSRLLNGRSISEIAQWIWDKNNNEYGTGQCLSGRLEFIASKVYENQC